MSLTTVVKRTRRSAEKVRTGCITCKSRRVKCDEKKPSCLRCTNSGRKCDGYATISSDSKKDSPNVNGIAVSTEYSISILSGLSDSVRYLEFYYHCGRPALSSNFDNEFWSRTALQMAQSEPSVRYSLIALGFYYKTGSGSVKHDRFKLVDENGHNIFLLHYNKAVRSLLDRMKELTYDSELVLVTCLLFICIEFIVGNYRTAFDHLNSGLKLISEWQRRRKRGDVLLSSGVSIRPSESSALIDNTLIPIFTRLLTTALTYGSPLPGAFNISFPAQSEIRKQPFSTLLDAQISVHQIRNASTVFIRGMAAKFHYGQPITAQDRQQHAHLFESLDAWLEAFETFEKKNQLSNEDKATVHVLKASYQIVSIFLSRAMDSGQTKFDSCLESFKAVNRHCEAFLNSMQTTTLSSSSSPSPPSSKAAVARAHFTFEVTIILPLFFVATTCRCPVTRRKAISLLSRNPPREGICDVQQHLVISKRVIELEESEVDPTTGWPVERTRIWVTTPNEPMDTDGKFQMTFIGGTYFQGIPIGPNNEGRMWNEWFYL